MSEDLELKLIETKQPFELSFSKIPFKGVVIFTDHCDFDSDILLRRQREFFEKHAIKSTKGFFLRKHSHKGEWNSAFEGNESEFQEWIKDGHELANHSLSQSGLADPKENQKLFENFKNPSVISPVKVWIDHGYQTYNLTKTVDLKHLSQSMRHLKSRGINMIWNYFDVTEACDSLNQLDYEQATLSRIFKAKGLRILDKIRIAFFHLSNENNLLLYRQTAGILKKREFKSNVLLFKNLMRMALGINYKLNLSLLIKRSQTVFNSELDGLQGFQSITVKDWVHALNLPLKRLQSESGLAIIHSYFAFLGKHHLNPLFLNKEGGTLSESIIALPLAVGNKLAFQAMSSAGTNSNIIDSGDNKVLTVAIDDIIKSCDCSFLNMDIEGGELDALKGAQNLIKNCRPSLAISIYHQPKDLWQICLFLDELNLGYKFFIRNYTGYPAETLFYATVSENASD